MSLSTQDFIGAPNLLQSRVRNHRITPSSPLTRGPNHVPISLSIPPPRDGYRRFYPSMSKPKNVKLEQALLNIGMEFAPLTPMGKDWGTFSLYTDGHALSRLSWEALSRLLASLHGHDVSVEITLTEGPLSVSKTIKLKGDAAFVLVLAAKGSTSDANHLRAINRLLAAGLCNLVSQLKEHMNANEPLRQYFMFFDQNRLADLAAQVILRTRQDLEGEHTRALCTLMDLFESNFDAHLKRLKKPKLDLSEFRKIATTLAYDVQEAVNALATESDNNGNRLLTREAEFRMRAIGDSIVPAAYYQTSAKHQNKDARNKDLVQDIVNMTIGTTLKVGIGLALNSTAGGPFIDTLLSGLVESFVPVRSSPGKSQLCVHNQINEMKSYAGRLSGYQGSAAKCQEYAHQAQDLRWYAEELSSTWDIPSFRLDRVGESCRASESARSGTEMARQRSGSVFGSLSGFFKKH